MSGINKRQRDILVEIFGLNAERAAQLLAVSEYVAADAYFSKRAFADDLAKAGLHLISRLRYDADLLYPYTGPEVAGKGRPKNRKKVRRLLNYGARTA